MPARPARPGEDRLSLEAIRSYQDPESLRLARRNLLRDLRQFESDSIEWARYVERGYRTEGDRDSSLIVACPREAAEILSAVVKARGVVLEAERAESAERVGRGVDDDDGGGLYGEKRSGRKRDLGLRNWKICGCFCWSAK